MPITKTNDPNEGNKRLKATNKSLIFLKYLSELNGSVVVYAMTSALTAKSYLNDIDFIKVA